MEPITIAVRRRIGLLAMTLGLLLVAAGPAAVFAASSAPAISNERAKQITKSEVTLEAVINPDGSETQYAFWVVGRCHPKCTKPEERVVGSGTLPAGNERRKVGAEIAHLEKNSEVIYWIVATNASGTTESHHRKFRTGRKEPGARLASAIAGPLLGP